VNDKWPFRFDSAEQQGGRLRKEGSNELRSVTAALGGKLRLGLSGDRLLDLPFKADRAPA